MDVLHVEVLNCENRNGFPPQPNAGSSVPSHSALCPALHLLTPSSGHLSFVPGQAVEGRRRDANWKADFCALHCGPGVTHRHVPQDTRPQTDPERDGKVEVCLFIKSCLSLYIYTVYLSILKSQY